MPIIFEYLLKVSIALAVVYLFYQLLLRRLTFYNWNRWYLLGYSLLAFVIPFLNITDFLFKHELQQNNFVQWIPAFKQLQLKPQGIVWDVWTIALLVFSSGVLLMGIRVVLQLISLHKIKRKATLLNTDDVKLYHVQESIVPFSFNNAIYVNSELHTEAELQEIIRHEFVHVKQKHSIDILLAELLCIILWFNPVAWFIRKSIRQNLEFIADHKVLEEGLDKKQYQYLLLKVVGNNHYSITPKFNFSSLKNRIIMMNQNQSARMQAIRFLFVLPLVAVLLLAFREVKENRIFSNNKPLVTDTIPPPPPPALPSVIESMNVLKARNTVVIKLKNGKTETYNLNDAKQKAAFEKMYGEIKPPPPATAPPEISVTTPAHEQVVMNAKGYYVTIADNHGECIVIVKDKGKKIIEALKLTDWDAKETMYKNKYGEIPPPPKSVSTPVTVTTAVAPTITTTVNPTVAVVPEVKATSPVVGTVQVSSKTRVTNAVAPTTSVNVIEKTANTNNNNNVNVSTTTSPKKVTISTTNADKALYYINDKEASLEKVYQLNPELIESVNVIKGDDATKTYGEKGRYGVILIKTKK